MNRRFPTDWKCCAGKQLKIASSTKIKLKEKDWGIANTVHRVELAVWSWQCPLTIEETTIVKKAMKSNLR